MMATQSLQQQTLSMGSLANSGVVGSRTQIHVMKSNTSLNKPAKRSSCTSSRPTTRRMKPDTCYCWVVLAASFIANLLADGCIFSFGVIFVELLDYFNETKAKTAWVGSLYMAVPLVTGPIASIITNRFGCRKTTILGSVIASIGFILSSVTNSIGQLCFTLGIVAGIGLSMVDVAANVVVAYYFEKRRAFATSTAAAGSGIGTFVMAVLTEWLIQLYTWKGTMLILGGIMLHMVVCGALFLPIDISSDHHQQSTPEDTECSRVEEGEEEEPEEGDNKIRDRSCLKFKCHIRTISLGDVSRFLQEALLNEAVCHSIGFIYFAVSCFLLYMWYDIPYIYLPDKASNMAITDSKASFLVSIMGIVSTVGQILIGYLGDRPKVDTFYLYTALTCVAGLVTMIMPVFKDYPGMAFYAAVYGFFISANYALTTILLVELVGLDQLSSSYGLLLLVQGIANLIGPPIAGWISDVAGNYDSTFYVAGAGILLSGLMLFARPWLMRCAPNRYYGSDVYRDAKTNLPSTTTNTTSTSTSIAITNTNTQEKNTQPQV